MSNVNKYFVRIKILKELTKSGPDPSDEYTDEENEVYKMFKKYGGKKLWVWCETRDMNAYFSNEILNDKELDISKDNRLFYKDELIFLPDTRIILDEHLFEL